MTVPPGSAHLSEEILAAWVDGALSREERAVAAAHLVDCDECRALVVDTRGVIRGHQGPVWRTRLAVGGLAAAAAVALLVLAPDIAVTPGTTPVTRTNGAHPIGEDVQRFASLGPPHRSTIVPDTTVLRWQSLDVGTIYQVTISNERGDLLLSIDTRDTTLSLDRLADTFIVGETYYWVVDAQLPNLRSARTTRSSFQVAQP